MPGDWERNPLKLLVKEDLFEELTLQPKPKKIKC